MSNKLAIQEFQIDDALSKRLHDAEVYFGNIEEVTADNVDIVNKSLSEVVKLKREVKKQGEEFRRPYNQMAKKIKAAADEIEARIDKVSKPIAQKVHAYKRKIEAQRAAAIAEQRRLEAERAAVLAEKQRRENERIREELLREKSKSTEPPRIETPEPEIIVPEAPKVEIPKEVKTATQTRKVKKIKIVDERRVPLEYWTLDRSRVRADALAGKEIPGVEIYEEEILVTR